MLNKIENDETLRLTSNVDFTLANTHVLQGLLTQAMGEVKARTVVLDLSRTGAIDSTGIRLLLSLFKTCQERELGFGLEVCSQSVFNVLTLCKMNQLFDIKEI